MEEWSTHLHGKVEESGIGRPSSSREEPKRKLAAEIESGRYSLLLEKAGMIYSSLTSGGL